MKKFLIGLLLLPFSVLAQYDAGYIEIQTQGSAGSFKMGQTAELGRFRLSNRTGKTINLNGLRLRNYGSAKLSDSFENIRIENNDYSIGTAVFTDRKSVQFRFDNIEIGRGDSLVLSVVGRLIYAKAGQTVKLGIQYEEDVKASLKGVNYFSLECRSCRGQRAKTQILRGGGIYVNPYSPYQGYRYYGSRRAPNDISRYYRTPISNKSYSQGTKGITFFTTYLNSKSPFRVDGVFLNIANGSIVSDKNGNGIMNELEDFNQTFSDFTLYVNGQREDSSNEFSVYQGRVGLWFNNRLDLPANSQLILSGRIENSATTGDKVKFSLDKTGLIDPVYIYNGDSIDLGNIKGGSRSNFTESTINEPLSINK